MPPPATQRYDDGQLETPLGEEVEIIERRADRSGPRVLLLAEKTAAG